jgi:hypothetical protein
MKVCLDGVEVMGELKEILDLGGRAFGDIQKAAQLYLAVTATAFGNIGWNGCNSPAYLAGQPK